MMPTTAGLNGKADASFIHLDCSGGCVPNFTQFIKALHSITKGCTLKSNEIFFCLGYCGWEKGQLENEIKENSWIILNEQIDFISKSIDWKRKMIE